MATRAEILSVIYEALNDLNAQLPVERRLGKAESTILIGEGSTIDSLGVVELLVNVEERVTAATGRGVALLESVGQHLSGQKSDVATLADLILAQLA